VIESTYKDNPYFPATLAQERLQDLKDDKDKHDHIWLGQPLGAGLKIYASKFTRAVNVREEDREELFNMLKSESVGCFMGMDPHSKYYPFCVWLAVILNEHNEPEHIIYNEFPTYDYFDDYYANKRTTKELKLDLKELARLLYGYDGNEYGLQVGNRFVDTRYSKGSGGENVMTNTVGMIETWKRPENGSLILCSPAEKMIDIQRAAIKTDLAHDKDRPIGPFNRPKLTVAPWCINMIDMFENHREARDGKGEDEKRKDASDALRILYAGISGMVFKRKQVVNVGRRRAGSWMSR
jgi:hypothetical protein